MRRARQRAPAWAFVNVNVRTYYAEGSKTLAFEVAEQLGWQAPDHVVVPVASGSQLTKVDKGFKELHDVGLLDEEPHVRVSGAQAAGCSPVATAFAEGTDAIRPGEARHDRQVARHRQPGRRLVRPRDRPRQRAGRLRPVTDEEIVDGIRLLARTEGIFAETAGGVTIATLAKLAAEGVVRPDERVVAYVTGNGLKTVEALADDGGPDRDDRSDARGLRRSRGRRRRPSTGATGERHRPDPDPAPHRSPAARARSPSRGSTVGEVLKALDAAHPGFGDRLFDDNGGAAPVRERLRRRRGRPLPPGPRHARRRRPDPLDRPGGRRRSGPGPGPPPSSAGSASPR